MTLTIISFIYNKHVICPAKNKQSLINKYLLNLNVNGDSSLRYNFCFPTIPY